MLRRLRLQFAGCRRKGISDTLHESDVRAAEVVAHHGGLLEGTAAFDIANCSTNFRDDDVRTLTVLIEAEPDDA